MSYVYMKVLESAPKRYDRGVSVLTLKQLKKIQQKIVEICVHPGAKVLDIGCGTGSLAVMAAHKGATVVGIDISPEMLDIANEKIVANKVQEKVKLLRMGAVEMDRAFERDSFDTIVSTLTFSEFSEDEVDYVIKQCHRVLKKELDPASPF
ncbi:MAG: corrinoid protein-associated methyltransferase CpaM [bacterium]